MVEKLILKKGEEKRLVTGHLWIYSNEIDTARSPLKNYTPGQVVNVTASDGKPLGTAYLNPNSLLCARLLSRRHNETIDVNWFVKAFEQAVALRESLYPQPYYRLVHSEGDFLPGLVIDRFGDVFVVQLNTAGMDRLREVIVEALRKVFSPIGILLRNDSPMRALENLPEEVVCVHGDVPSKVQIVENNTLFDAPLLEGQKTGWFFDHRLNRERMTQYVKGKSVLDLFCYAGGWGVQAAKAGASSVTLVDASAFALQYARDNAAKNQITLPIDTIEEDVFDALKKLADQGRKYDVIIVDPPAFVKRKKDIEQASNAYFRANLLAAQILSPGGILMSSSCSFHFSPELLARTLLRVSQKTGRKMQNIERLSQAPDHPVHPAIIETAYLKGFVCRFL